MGVQGFDAQAIQHQRPRDTIQISGCFSCPVDESRNCSCTSKWIKEAESGRESSQPVRKKHKLTDTGHEASNKCMGWEENVKFHIEKLMLDK